MSPVASTPPFRAIQLVLELRTASARVSRAKELRPYWDHVDLVDVGAELHARAPGVRALLGAEKRPDGRWIGYHDVLHGHDGSSARTMAGDSRVDALASAAYQLVRHCEAVLSSNGASPKADAMAARRILRWLRDLDLL